MTLEENKAVVRRFVHEGIVGGDLAVIDELCSAECINHSAVPEARIGTEGVKRVTCAASAGNAPQFGARLLVASAPRAHKRRRRFCRAGA